MSKETHNMILACTNPNGEPDLAFVRVTCTSEECDEYSDKTRAIEWALSQGFEEPFVVFNCSSDTAGKAIADSFVWETASVVEVV